MPSILSLVLSWILSRPNLAALPGRKKDRTHLSRPRPTTTRLSVEVLKDHDGKVLFQPDSGMPGAPVKYLILQPDGKIVTASSGTAGGLAELRRLDANGALDASFGGGTGIVAIDAYADSSEIPMSLALQSDGKIVMTGVRDPFGDIPNQMLLLRYNSDGSPDTTFGSEGAVTTVFSEGSEGHSVRVQQDGKLVVFGEATIGGVSQFAVVRYNTDGSLDASAALLAAAPAASTGNGTGTLTPDEVRPLFKEAVARWSAAGADPSRLAGVQVQIAELPGTMLGGDAGKVIALDTNAAGWGWFIDSTPHDDSEFITPGDQGEQNRMDLLTVLMHEMGHVLGLAHDSDGVMQETLTPGTRLLPTPAEAAATVVPVTSTPPAPLPPNAVVSLPSVAVRDAFFAHLAETGSPTWDTALAIALLRDFRHGG